MSKSRGRAYNPRAAVGAVPRREASRWVRTRAYDHQPACGAVTLDEHNRRHVCAQAGLEHRGWHVTADGYAWNPDDPTQFIHLEAQ